MPDDRKRDAARDDRVEWNKERPEQGESPYTPPGIPEDEREERAEQDQLDWSGNDPEAGITWEELRKGLPPQTPDNDDEVLYDERFTSERQAYDQPERSWKEIDTDSSADQAPEWPPKANPPSRA